MHIYFVRHAEAVARDDATPDEVRFLTRDGRKQARRVGKTLRKLGVAWTRAYTSPLVRAVQTAEIVGARLKFRGEIAFLEALEPGKGSWKAFMAALKSQEQAGSFALVGHEPDLGIALGEALGTDPIAMPKGAVAALAVDDAGKVRPVGMLKGDSDAWKPLPEAVAKTAAGKAAADKAAADKAAADNAAAGKPAADKAAADAKPGAGKAAAGRGEKRPAGKAGGARPGSRRNGRSGN
ncbi:MAG: phosphohistidine phosphatase SixA [Candidatus Sericytochromatia bacterium]|uniref:Phosphohistidine phosphatase SixA n=1 Tax=Candidatus Tanganyikabacteria bacterium TaxID=2961651 RepID=A0A938BJE0_9BACT|nr:phosphohistidine phosphatase SixA [Candidatus Tanganyikabacteria bacterium]